MRPHVGRLVSSTTLVVVVAVAVLLSATLLGAAYVVEHGDDDTSRPPQVLPVAATAPVTVADLGAAPLPTRVGLAAVLRPLLRDPDLGSHVEASVVDARTGRLLFARDATAAAPPASTAKLATATAALDVLGPDTVFRTRTVLVRTPGAMPRVVLVGGGDPTLAGPGPLTTAYPRPARLATLAAATAHALTRRHITHVGVAVDDSLFVGPLTAPGWKPNYVPEGSVAPVTALEVDGGRIDPHRTVGEDQRYADPSLGAGTTFATLLARHGVRTKGAVTRTTVTAKAGPLASVSSPPLDALVGGLLQRSDNDLAEALARHVAIAAGAPASFSGGADAVRAALARLGISASDVALVDGSGLSTLDRVTPRGLTGVIRLDASRPLLRPVVAGLPIGAVSGTLTDRFRRTPAPGHPLPGAGVVRAKTGTLSGVSTLAGLVVDADGRQLAFAVLGSGIDVFGTDEAEAALDRFAGALARCGCR